MAFEISNDVFRKLANALNRNQAWMTVVNFLGIFSENELRTTNFESPGEKLLLNLMSKECTFQNLCDILKECKLYDALSVIYTKHLVIEKQLNADFAGNKMVMRRGTQLHLEFMVTGVPQPTYLWYHNELLVPNETLSVLHINYYSAEMQGSYYSIAVQTLSDGRKESLKSNVIEVETLVDPCMIITQPPAEICVQENKEILLQVIVDAHPPPTYQWTHNNKVLQLSKNCLRIRKATKHIAGTYRCRISNSANELITQTRIKVLDAEYLLSCSREPVPEKLALLIANEQYANQPPLSTPKNDVTMLKEIFESLDFLVICVTNQTLADMRNVIRLFCEMLAENSMVVFYFGGHGFELGGKYLLPTDAPDANNYRFRDSVAECQILRDVLDTKPKLFLSLLDMCLNLPNRSDNVNIYSEQKEHYIYKAHRNLIQGYSTTRGLSAYESKGGNSLYTLALTKYLAEDLSVLKILSKVNQSLEKFNKHLPSFEQVSNVSFNVAQDFCLNVKKQGNPESVRKWKQFQQQNTKEVVQPLER